MPGAWQELRHEGDTHAQRRALVNIQGEVAGGSVAHDRGNGRKVAAVGLEMS